MWDQGCHLFEPAGRVMTDPHILSTAELTAQRAGHSGAGRQRTGVVATLQMQREYEPFDRLRATGGFKKLGRMGGTEALGRKISANARTTTLPLRSSACHA
jgi:hypothetical protein